MKKPEPFYARETTADDPAMRADAVYSKEEMDEYLRTLEPPIHVPLRNSVRCLAEEIELMLVANRCKAGYDRLLLGKLCDVLVGGMDSLSPEPTMPWTPAPNLPRPNVSTPSAGPPVQWKHWTPEPVRSKEGWCNFPCKSEDHESRIRTLESEIQRLKECLELLPPSSPLELPDGGRLK